MENTGLHVDLHDSTSDDRGGDGVVQNLGEGLETSDFPEQEHIQSFDQAAHDQLLRELEGPAARTSSKRPQRHLPGRTQQAHKDMDETDDGLSPQDLSSLNRKGPKLFGKFSPLRSERNVHQIAGLPKNGISVPKQASSRTGLSHAQASSFADLEDATRSSTRRGKPATSKSPNVRLPIETLPDSKNVGHHQYEDQAINTKAGESAAHHTHRESPGRKPGRPRSSTTLQKTQKQRLNEQRNQAKRSAQGEGENQPPSKTQRLSVSEVPFSGSTKKIGGGHASNVQANASTPGIPRSKINGGVEDAPTRTGLSVSSSERSPEPTDDVREKGGLLGQSSHLKLVRENRAHIVNNINVYLEDVTVINIQSMCLALEKGISRLKDSSGDVAGTFNLSSAFDTIQKGVRDLCGGTGCTPAINSSDSKRWENIYFHLIPTLAGTTVHVAESFMTMDKEDVEPEVSVTSDHMRFIVNLIGVTLEMGEGVNNYTKPKDVAVGVRRIQAILASLRKMGAVFTKHLNVLEHTRRQEQQLAEAMRQHRHEEKVAAAVSQVRKKWRALHEERRWVEAGIIPLRKQQHLRIPDFVPELDNEGVEFERLEIFKPRVGPPPSLIAAARKFEWTIQEENALCDGLRAFYGPLVFEKIFRQHCRRNGMLNRFNVTEIVTKAADLKEYEGRRQMAELAHIQDWVGSIPEWTKPHTLVGEENEENEEHVVHEE